MDKELPLDDNAPSQMAGFLHYAGAMGHAKQSPRAWPGTCRSPDCDANCGVGTRSPTRTPVADGLCSSRAFATLGNDQAISLIANIGV